MTEGAPRPGSLRVRFGPESRYGPFVYDDAAGRSIGLSVDLLALVAARAGLDVQTLPSRPLHEWLEAARQGEVDLLSSLRPTPERSAFLLFTRPYASVPAVVAVRSAAGMRPTPVDLRRLAGRPVAVGRGYAVEAVVRGRHPDVAWQPVPDDLEAMRGVAGGRFEAAVLDAASLSHLRRTQGLGTVHAAGHVDFDYALCFAVRRDWPALRDRIDEAIAQITPAERQAVMQRWMPDIDDGITGGNGLPRVPVASAAGAALLGLAGVAALAALWQRRREVAATAGDAAAARPNQAPTDGSTTL